MSNEGHSFHDLSCLGHAARKLLDRAIDRGDAEVLVHVNGVRVHISPVDASVREERQSVSLWNTTPEGD